MKKLVVFLAVALVLPLATALNCQGLSGANLELCNQIIQSTLTQSDKDLLITDLLNPNKYYPDHDFIYSWNVGLNIKNSPNGIYSNSGVIRNAWVKALTLMPSVVENGTLYLPSRTKLLSAYNYEIVLPSGKQKKDCKTYYSLKEKNEKLNIIVNGKVVGQNKLTEFEVLNPTAKVISELILNIKYEVKHYRYNDDGYCRYDYSTYSTDSITLRDEINAKVYFENLDGSFKIIDEHNGAYEGILKTENATGVKLSFSNSLYQKNNYFYSLNYTPYGILILYAQETNSTKIQNLFVDDTQNKTQITVDNPKDCKLEIYNHFNSKTILCNLDYEQIEFEIKTDKTIYEENETISLKIIPDNLQINISYANKTFSAKDSVNFTAEREYNKIIGQLNNKKIKRVINVTDPANKKFLIDFSSITLFGFVLYSFMKKYYLSIHSI